MGKEDPSLTVHCINLLPSVYVYSQLNICVHKQRLVPDLIENVDLNVDLRIFCCCSRAKELHFLHGQNIGGNIKTIKNNFNLAVKHGQTAYFQLKRVSNL